MSDDFVADFERQLREAASQRLRGRPHRRSRRRPGRLIPSPAVAAAACVLLTLIVAVGWLGASGSSDGDGETPADRSTRRVALSVPAAQPIMACPNRSPREIPASSPAEAAQLGVFDRTPAASDRLPDVSGNGDYSWVPASSVLPDEARRAGAGRTSAAVHLVPTLGILDKDGCATDSRPPRQGVCMTVETGSQGLVVRCFTVAEIQRGRAAALTGSTAGRVHGIVPDGIDRVRISSSDGQATTGVVDNVYEARVPGLSARDRLVLEFVSSTPPTPCEPSATLREAVPALGAPAGRRPPEQLAAVVNIDPALAKRWARRWNEAAGLRYWVVPELRCGVTTDNDRACVAVGSRFVEGAVCGSADDIARTGVSDWFPIDGRPVVVGFAPGGARTAVVVLRGHGDQSLGVSNGVFAGQLPRSVRMDRPDAFRVEFE